MGKAALATPLYLTVAWTLMVSYQLFTQTAVTTVVTHISLFSPSFGSWLNSRIDMIVFIYAFAWVFVLSSVIPSVILGKERSVLVQFFVILALTFLTLVIRDILNIVWNSETIDQIFSLAVLFEDLFPAVGYLSMPYLLMLTLDVYSRVKRKKEASGNGRLEVKPDRKYENVDSTNQ